MSAAAGAFLDWAVASRPLEGKVSGDGHWVQAGEDSVRLAVLDGLGHGAEAAEATSRAQRALAGFEWSDPVSAVRECHRQLAKSRGVAMCVAQVDVGEGILSWLAVGNVEGVVVRAPGQPKEHVMMRAGVVGSQLPELRTARIPVRPGEWLLLATDGLRPGFDAALERLQSPQQNAERLLAGSAKSTDDALILVARYRGRAA